MTLFYRQLGAGPAVVVVHGLYGSSDNWMGIARELSARFTVYLVDLRNHGRSPHADSHTYPDMAADLLELADTLQLTKAVWIGHSMGGKVVIEFGHRYPERVASLVVIDISPRAYTLGDGQWDSQTGHAAILSALATVDLARYTSREAVDAALAPYIVDGRTRQFLLKNLKRDASQGFVWALNIEALRQNLTAILSAVPTVRSAKAHFAVLFVRGMLSTYLSDADNEVISAIFPQAQMVSIPKAGHWVHAEQPQLLLKNLLYFLEN